MSTLSSEMRRPRIGAVLIALALAIALALLLFQAKSILSDRTAPASFGSLDRVETAFRFVRPGEHRGTVRVGPVGPPMVRTHAPDERPKWTS